MNLLVVAATYPFNARPQTAIFTERCVLVLKDLCREVVVVSPRPVVPPFLGRMNARWHVYDQMPARETRSGVLVCRPGYLQIPVLDRPSWTEQGKFWSSRRLVCRLDRRIGFDAILAFDIFGAGGLAWRLGRVLKVPVAGWALGSDVRAEPGSPAGQIVTQTLQELDLVFYQSEELRATAAGFSPHGRWSGGQHIVLPHGIPFAPPLDRESCRNDVRAAWGVGRGEIVLLHAGRILRSKGIDEILSAFCSAAARDSRLTCVMVGASPGFDETAEVRAKLEASPGLRNRVKIFPVRPPEEVWKLMCAADIFVFASHAEGMPNSLLEAMASGLPAVAFGIPAVLEIDAGTNSLKLVPPFDERRFAEAILELSASPTERSRLGLAGRELTRARFSVRENVGRALGQISRLCEGRKAASQSRTRTEVSEENGNRALSTIGSTKLPS